MKRIAQILTLVGFVALVVSVFWWFQTYGLNVDYLKCLAVTSGMCKIGRIGSVFGGNPYNPLLLFAALVCLVLGLGLHKLKKS